MAVTINGTTGIAGVDGSAGTPAVQGADSNTGMFFPAADTIAFAEGGTEVMRIDSSGEVTRFNTNPGGMTIKRTDGVNSNGWLNFVGSDDVVDGSVRMATDAANALTFLTAATERARIDSTGNFSITQAPGKYTVDTSGGATSIANGGTVDFPNASGMLVVNNWLNGAVTIYLCGGGNTATIGSVIGTTGSFAFNSGVNGYRWTNNYGSTGTFGFFFVRTRSNA